MHTYNVTVTRDDKWWMIAVPELDGHVGADGTINLSTATQARRLADVPGAAVDFICTVMDAAPSEVGVKITRADAGQPRQAGTRCAPRKPE